MTKRGLRRSRPAAPGMASWKLTLPSRGMLVMHEGGQFGADSQMNAGSGWDESPV